MTDPNNLNTFEWIFQHIQILTPTALIYAVWRVTRFFTIVETRVLEAEGHVTKMATNCMPTIQASLQTQDGLLHSMDTSLKTLANGAGGTPRKARAAKR